MSAHNSLVATYAKRSAAAADVAKLQQAGFDPRQLFVAARDGRAKVGEELGATFIGELGALDATLFRIGVPQEDVLDYEAEFNIDRLLLAAHGSPGEIARAKRILDAAHPASWDASVGCSVYYGCFD